MISLIRKNEDFECNTLMNWKPMKVHQSFSDMIKFWNSAKYACGSVQYLLLLLLLFASSSDFFPLVNPVVPGLGRRTPRSCLLASSTV